MNLTKTHKSAIVRAIMQDIPQIDYSALIRDYVQAEAVKLMPPEVRALYDNVETRCYLTCAYVQVRGYHNGNVGTIFWRRSESEASTYSVTLYLSKRSWNDHVDGLSKRLVDIVYGRVEELAALSEAQDKARDSMRQKLETMLAGIRTLKQAKTLLEPELHKYLPAEPPKGDSKDAQASTALVPYVVANLREMGWPKDQETKTEEVV